MNATQRRIVEDGFARPREAAQFLGVSRTRLYDLINGGVLTHIRQGKRICIPWAVVREYAAQRLKLGSVA